MKEGLTQKQADVYNAIMEFKINNGYPPTLVELSQILKKSTGAIRSCMRILQRKKFIEIEKYKKRAIKLK